ncbi:MAG: DNA polymerase III subunit delta [Pseudomonadota bacterium]
MQLGTQQLREHLKQGILPLYFVYGDEPLQIRDNTDMLRKAAKYYGYEEREVYSADASFDWQQLHQAASEISLFSSKKLIEIYLPSGKIGDKGSKAIIKYCQNLISDNLLLLYTGELDSPSRRSKWFKQIQAAGVVVAVYPLKEQQLFNWLQTRLYKEGLQCDNEGIKFLAESVEGNLLAADQEIIKLGLLYKPALTSESPTKQSKPTDLENISLQQILAAVQNNARYKGFDLFDTVLKGQSTQVVAMLKTFEQDGTAIVWLLFILAKEIRSMAIISAYQQQMQLAAAMNKVYIFAQRKSLIEQVLRKNTAINWNNYILQLAEVDKQIKGVAKGDPWLSLNSMLLKLSQQIQNS